MTKENPRQNSNDLLHCINSAYDPLSSGMGLHLRALQLLVAGDEIPDDKHSRYKSSLYYFPSNYLYMPYAFKWLHPGWSRVAGTGPQYLSPHSENHLKLMTRTKKEYDDLDWQVIRMFLAGENGLSGIKKPYQPIARNELPYYLREAINRGVLICNVDELNRIKTAQIALDFINGMIDNRMIKENGVNLFVELYFTDRFKPLLIKAAIYKLGSMLALTDQITYDAQARGTPISYGYKPPDLEEDQEVPSIGQLYEQAHSVLITTVNPKDKHVQYLFPLNKLPQLV